jgi:hypothetical protein
MPLLLSVLLATECSAGIATILQAGPAGGICCGRIDFAPYATSTESGARSNTHASSDAVTLSTELQLLHRLAVTKFNSCRCHLSCKAQTHALRICYELPLC